MYLGLVGRVSLLVVTIFVLVEMFSLGTWLLNQPSDLAILGGSLVMFLMAVVASFVVCWIVDWR